MSRAARERGAIRGSCVALATAASAFLVAGEAMASECERTSVGLTPIPALGAETYLGLFQGGLYPNGSNTVPLAHAQAGLARAQMVVPRDAKGEPAGDGRIGVLSIGMSNATQEWCAGDGPPCTPWSFTGRSGVSPLVDASHIRIANGAKGGQVATTWDAAGDPNYDRVRDEILRPAGLTEQQVQVIWLKVANPTPSVALPDQNADAYRLLGHLGNVVRALQARYPNLQQVYLTSRIYAGYASTSLNPEPYAYESGFSVKWLIEAQIAQMSGGPVDSIAGDLSYDGSVPWLAWGPYLWADGMTPNTSGLLWQCADFAEDGTHPSESGQSKVGQALYEFFLSSPFTEPWFATELAPSAGDLNGDGKVNGADLSILLGSWGVCARCIADITGDGIVNGNDLAVMLAAWTE
jgi:hypothetical protein